MKTVNFFGVIWFWSYVYIIPGEPDWIVNKRVSGYGDNLTLFCLIDDCCTKAGGWIKFDPDYETIYLDVRNSKNTTPKDKYAATTNNNGFSLVIKNIQKEDINIKYLCLYGFEKSRQKVLRQSDAFKGPDHETYRFGNCSCTYNFTDENCGCSTRNDSCISSDGNKACVQCVVLHTGEYKDSCDEKCGNRNVLKKPSLPEEYNICEFKDEDDCTFYFTYDYDDNNELKIIAQETKECPTKMNVLAIVLGVVIGIVLVCLALLFIWKLVTTINIMNEMKEIELEFQRANWNTHCSLLFMLFETFPWTPICKVLTLIVTCVVLQVLWKRRNTVRQWDVLIFYEPLEDPWKELVGHPSNYQKDVIDNETTMLTKKADFYIQHYSYF